MKIYVDTDSRKLVRSELDSSAATRPYFTQGDNEPIEVVLLTKGNVNVYDTFSTTEGDSIRVGIGLLGTETKLLSLSEASFLSEGKTIVELPLYTKELVSTLQSKSALNAMLEIQLTSSSGNVTTLYQGDCVVRNELISSGNPPENLISNYYTKEEMKAEIFNIINKGDTFVGKIAISPTSKNLLLFCPDGKWRKVIPAISDGVQMLTLSEDSFDEIA